MRTRHASKAGIFHPRLILTSILFAIGGSLAFFSWASNPPTSNVTVPGSGGQKIEVTWTGEIPPLVNGTSDCYKCRRHPGRRSTRLDDQRSGERL